MNDIHFSSKNVNWSTPQTLFEDFDKIFKFGLDACASKENNKCLKYFTKEENSLNQSWNFNNSNVWCNPPYGREIKSWIKKAYEESLSGITVVMLVPARTDTSWWHDYCMKGHIKFLRRRLKFSNNKNNAPFPSAIIIFYGII